MDLKNLFKGKAVGFYVLLASIVLTLITAFVYLACCSGKIVGYEVFNVWSFIILLASSVISICLVIFKQHKLAPYALGLLNFLALLFYVYGVYYYVSVVMVGIDLDHFEPQFLISTILFVLTLGGSVTSVFMKLEEGDVE